MLVFADGRTVGTIGGGCYENDAFWKARDALVTGRSSLLHYELNDDFAQENGLVCGGQMDVHVDPLAPTPHLFVIGAGHVGWQLGKIAPDAGFRVHVVDDREKFANIERFPEAAEVVVELDPRVAASHGAAAVGLRRGRDPRAHPRPRRHAGPGRPRSQVSRPHRQPRQGAANLRPPPGRRHAAGMPGARATRRSASTSAPSLPWKSPSASWRSSSRSAAASIRPRSR